MLKLLIDDREKLVMSYFTEYDDIELEVKRLQIGDYSIMDDDKLLFCIERKSWNDLAASIKDGRTMNVNKLKLIREETGCKILYLIEGRMRHKLSKGFAHIPYKNLQSHLDHLIIRDDIFIIYSDNLQDTASRLIEFCRSYISLGLVKTAKTGGNVLEILTTVIKKTDEQIIYNLWSCIPNITTKTASVFIENGYHISDLLLGNIDVDEISSLQYPSKAIIGKRAEKIIKITKKSIETHKYHCKILAELPMITKKTAEVILKTFTMEDILNGVINEHELSEIKKTDKIKLGKTAASAIYKFLVK